MGSFRCPKGLVPLVAGLLVAPAAANAFAQRAGTLTGTVTDTRTGHALPGVQVLLPFLRLETRTGDRGRFEFENVPPGRHEIRAALVGCQLASRVIDLQPGQSVVVDLELILRPIALEGLIVTGVAEDPAEVDPAVALDRIGPSEGQAATSRTVGDLMQGRLAGARIIQGSGQPGDDPSIQLRGPTSIQGTQDPLVVVDGVISRGRAGDIDPLDIESINVLKGAAAAAIYGSQGQAGVIEITTKRGPGGNSAERERLMIIDGAITRRSLADVDPANIEDIEVVSGFAVEALFGTRAEAGVIRIATRHGSPAQEGDIQLVGCIDPSP